MSLVIHNCRPLPSPLSAEKNRVPLTLARYRGDELAEPGPMSFTSMVLAAVPMVLQSSSPVLPSVALKKSVPLTFVRNDGNELFDPGLMSLTSTVPAAAPFDL